MERDDDESAAFPQHRLGRAERLRELLQLAVDEDAERLKRAGRGMDAHAPAGPAAGDDLGQLAGAQDRRLGARPLDGTGDAPCLPLLAVAG